MFSASVLQLVPPVKLLCFFCVFLLSTDVKGHCPREDSLSSVLLGVTIHVETTGPSPDAQPEETRVTTIVTSPIKTESG